MFDMEKRIRIFVGIATMLLVAGAVWFTASAYESVVAGIPNEDLQTLRAKVFAIAIVTCFAIQVVCFSAVRFTIRHYRESSASQV